MRVVKRWQKTQKQSAKERSCVESCSVSWIKTHSESASKRKIKLSKWTEILKQSSQSQTSVGLVYCSRNVKIKSNNDQKYLW